MEITKIKLTLQGLADIMFDRFIDHSKDKRPPEQKLYLVEDNKVVLPQANIEAFLFGENPQGCAKAFEGKQGKEYIGMGMSHVSIEESFIPFIVDGKELRFDGFNGVLWIHQGTGGRTKQGSLSIKQEAKPRPVLKVPWFLNFTLTLVENTIINETKLYNWFVRGGIEIALGTYRPRWGRFSVDKWDIVKS